MARKVPALVECVLNNVVSYTTYLVRGWRVVYQEWAQHSTATVQRRHASGAILLKVKVRESSGTALRSSKSKKIKLYVLSNFPTPELVVSDVSSFDPVRLEPLGRHFKLEHQI